MTDSDWDKFAELVQKVVDMDGTWQEKAAILAAEMEERGCMPSLVDMASWIAD